MEKDTQEKMAQLGWEPAGDGSSIYVRRPDVIANDPIDWLAERPDMQEELDRRIAAFKREQQLA